MQLGFVGLGKMGLNMVTRLAAKGHDIVAYDGEAAATARAASAGARGAASLHATRRHRRTRGRLRRGTMDAA